MKLVLDPDTRAAYLFARVDEPDGEYHWEAVRPFFLPAFLWRIIQLFTKG